MSGSVFIAATRHLRKESKDRLFIQEPGPKDRLSIQKKEPKDGLSIQAPGTKLDTHPGRNREEPDISTIRDHLKKEKTTMPILHEDGVNALDPWSYWNKHPHYRLCEITPHGDIPFKSGYACAFITCKECLCWYHWTHAMPRPDEESCPQCHPDRDSINAMRKEIKA